MKKLIYLTFLAIGMTGCSVESMDSDELVTADANFRMQEASSTEMLFEEIVCAGEETTITVNFPQRTTPQGKNLPTNIRVELEVNDEWVEIYQENLNDVTTTSFNYTFDKAIDYNLRYSAENGPWNPTQTLSVDDCSECENSLEADLVCGEVNTLTVTFTAEEAGPIVIQGGLTNDTEIESATAVGLIRNTTHSGVVNSNANVTRWEGDVEACEEVTITITFTGGNGIGDWTAKRDGELLGETEEQVCSEEK